MRLLLVAALAVGCVLGLQWDRNADKVTSLPGLTFTPTFDQYSGYLPASPGNYLHYWLVESQTNPQWAPIVLWLNGGPGCSSMDGFFTEMGPFRPSRDGQTLNENVLSWNKFANMFFLEAPRDVGFSYRDPTYPKDTLYNDDKTANDNAIAVKRFFDQFPEYQNRPFYVTGESYGGVYVPTLTNLLITMIQNGSLPNVNLQGMAVGNGALSRSALVNSGIDLVYYRGIIGKPEFESMAKCCDGVHDTSKPLQFCTFTNYVDFDNFGNAIPKSYPKGSTGEWCANMTIKYGQDLVWNTYNDVYNTWEDCYDSPQSSQSTVRRGVMGDRYLRTFASALSSSSPISNGQNPFVDQGAKVNKKSTDSIGGFACWADDAAEAYLNRADVRKAIHIPDSVQRFQLCNDDINEKFYIQQNPDMTPVFNNMIKSGYKIHFLIYNGDADMACQFLGDQWFVEDLAIKNKFAVTAPRNVWNYSRSDAYDSRLAGFAKSFQGGNVTLDLLTVKGAGHMVPTDRPGPAYQMMFNFINNKQSYSSIAPINYTPRPLLSQYQTPPQPGFTRKQADRVWNLPGLTYNLNFKQYSGYLKGVEGNFLHYWLVESQSNPSSDPLILWLNGGPGCSSLGGFLTELGPFHPNIDNKTLFENIYSWNKGANVLFLEGPRNVGFSVQNFSVNPDDSYNDIKTANDNYLALKDFLTVFPEYVNRPFYVTGESYGGVYVPTLTSLLIDKIQSGNLPGLNLVGMAVGNGELSALQQINSAIHLLYFHGLYGKKEWDALLPCCQNTGDPTWFEYCDFSQHIYLDSAGNAQPRDKTSTCGPLVVELGQARVWNTINDVYNIYQDCYQQTSQVFGSRNLHRHKEDIRAHVNRLFQDQGSQISSFSTDNQGGFPCFASSAAGAYLNQDDVRAALHISPMAGAWTDCNDTINEIYIQQHNDTTSVFDHILSTNYPLRMLIYNGDVDTACNFLGDEWFIEAVAKRHSMSVSQARKEWRYMQQIAGYVKQFQFGKGTIDLMTVKGAGHLVPTDRPGPALQMITNFIRTQDYSNAVNFNLNQTPLKQNFQIALKISADDAAVNAVPFKSESEVSTAASGRLNRKGALKLKHTKAKNEKSGNRAKRAAKATPPPPPATTKAQDEVTNLPGLTFTPNYKQYSGYLDATKGNHLHYWLVESQNDPAKDPIVLWLNGGPGCSSLGGMLEELGPFGVNRDGATLFENTFSWNKYANVLFMEAPRGVGFSYRSNDVNADDQYYDDYTAKDNVLALTSFFNRFTEYKNRPFYITGESYGGVYIPTLTDLLIKEIQNGTFGQNSFVNLKGVAIGNGELSQIQLINSAVTLTYMKGLHGKGQYDSLKQCCQNLTGPMTYCNFMQYVNLGPDGNATPKLNDGSVAAQCGAMVVQQGFLDVWTTANDVYNTYQDCYSTADPSWNLKSDEQMMSTTNLKERRSKRAVRYLDNAQSFVNQAGQINYMSTDANQGYFCYNDDASSKYLNRDDVRKALHIPDGVTKWQDCNDDINANYVQQHNDTTPVFQSIIDSKYPLDVLIYNGDADMACQFLGDEWFIESLADSNKMAATARSAWNYTIPGNNSYNPRIGGYYKKFAHATTPITLLTVKGGGHMVPTDRPGPALQMIYNFINKRDYSLNIPKAIVRQPLLSNYVATPAPVKKMVASKVFDLPGLTFKPLFGQHSGYLKASDGVYLHYWFTESQNDPENDPVVLWLNGGPGCSSLGGLFTELGPFRPNPDGRTLFENVYSWNRGANVLFMEAPRDVGFSYQDKKQNNDTVFDDDKTAADNALAIADFFNIYEKFRKNDFYVSGESYGGVYVPTLTNLLIQKIQAKQLNVNLKGMVIGNGMLSSVQDARSLPDFMYFHGFYDRSEWQQLRDCCQKYFPSAHEQCDYTNFIRIGNDGGVYPLTFADPEQQKCANLVVDLAGARVENIVNNDVYNLYQDCYEQTDTVFGSAASDLREELLSTHKIGASKLNVQSAIVQQLSQLSDPISTDSQGAFQCYMTNALTKYLNQSHVRDAIHIPDFIQNWEFCTDFGGYNYILQHNDTSDIFQSMLDSKYPLRVLIYNGDVDTACSMFEAEYFIENFATKNNMDITKSRSEWFYQLAQQYSSQIAGYTKRFAKSGMSIDLLTVKGAGHFVPTDRPGPALQMIYNYLNNDSTYNTSIPYDLTRQPLYAQYQQTGEGTPAPPPTGVPSGSSTTSPSNTPMVTNTPPVVKTDAPGKTDSATSSISLLSFIIALFVFVRN